MHEYLKLLGTNNQHKTDRFLIYERALMSIDSNHMKKYVKWNRVADNTGNFVRFLATLECLN